MSVCHTGPSDDCVKVVRNIKTVQVPCTRNKCEQYTVKLPRQVINQVPRTVQYTDWETRQKSIPYTVTRPEQRTRMETQRYTVPVTTTQTRMVPVTRKVPKTVYVNMTTMEPQTYTMTTVQTRERQVPVPYYVSISETRYRTVTEQVPVQRTKVHMDTITKTEYHPEVRTHCVPETKIVTKQIPVYNLVPKSAPSFPTEAAYGNPMNFNAIDRGIDGTFKANGLAVDPADLNRNGTDINRINRNGTDINRNGMLPLREYGNVRQSGNLANSAGNGSKELPLHTNYYEDSYDRSICPTC